MKEWQEFVSEISHELGAKVVDAWMPKLARFDAGNLYLEAKDSFQRNWFNEHVRPRLKGFHNYNQRPIKIHLETEERTKTKQEDVKKLHFTQTPIDSEMTLENFIPCEKNLVVLKLLQEKNGPFNPIFLFGPKGVGKTHLLMGAAIALQKASKRVLFIHADTFTEHVVQAIRLGQMQDFRKIYRDIDALIIDDIQIFSKKTATQEEFFHTFNTLHTSGKLIIISANVAPMQLKEIEPRLISRFEWGISLNVEKTEVEHILEHKAKLWNMQLSTEIKKLLMEKFAKDPIMALQALTLRAKGGSVSALVAQKLLKDLLAKEETKALSSEVIVKSIAAQYGITSEDLLGKSQLRNVVQPRQIAMYLCREKLKLPYQKIGELFDRDHSTVMSSVKQIQKQVDEKKIELPNF